MAQDLNCSPDKNFSHLTVQICSLANFVSSSIDPAVSTCFVITLKAEGCSADSAVSGEPVLD